MRRAALVLVAVLLAGACSGATGASGAADGVVDIVLFGGPAEIAGYERLVASFEPVEPDVEVRLNPVARQDELLANLTTAFAGGQPPDVFLTNYLKYGQFAAQGVLEPVQPLLDASDVLDVGDFYEPPLEAFRFDGETLTCMPQNISSLVLYTNLDLLAAAGLEPPQPGWTWDDFLSAGRAVTDPPTYGVGIEPSLQRLAPFVWSNGGDMVDDPRRPTALTIADGPAREALDFFLDLQLVHGVAPPDAEEQSLGAEERFIAGDLAFYANSRKSVPTLRESIPADAFTWDVVPLPVAPAGEPATILHGDAYCVVAGTDVGDAWRFVEHAMTAEGQEILAQSGRTVPSRIDVATSPAFLEPEEPPASADVFLDVIPTIRALPGTGSWSQMQNQADEILADLFYGRIDRDDGVELLVDSSAAVLGLDVGQ